MLSACRGSSGLSSGSVDGVDFLRCAASGDDGVREILRLPPLTLERDGAQLKIKGLKSAQVNVGVLAGLAEASPATLENLDYFLARFKEGGVQLIVVVGGLGTAQSDIEGLMQRLGTAPVPILVVPGAEENADVFRALTAKLHKKLPQLVDMTRVQRVEVGKLTFVSLPGAGKPFYLNADERGCGFDPGDLNAVLSSFDDEGVQVILSPTPPRGSGEWAVDRTRAGVNIGDIALRTALDEKKVRFGVFGYVYEAGGHAVLSDGETEAAAGIWTPSLWLQAGAAEALPMFVVGEGRTAGMAHVVSFSADRARFQRIDVSSAK